VAIMYGAGIDGSRRARQQYRFVDVYMYMYMCECM